MAEYALRSSLFGNGDALHGNWWTAVILSVGKVGALFAGFVMKASRKGELPDRCIYQKLPQNCWKPPNGQNIQRGYAVLFGSVLMGGLSLSLLPMAYVLEQSDVLTTLDRVASRAMVFACSFLFFLFSTGPKIGFETLLQGMAADVEGSGAIFGFVGTFITIIGRWLSWWLSKHFSWRTRIFNDSVRCRLARYHGTITRFRRISTRNHRRRVTRIVPPRM